MEVTQAEIKLQVAAETLQQVLDEGVNITDPQGAMSLLDELHSVFEVASDLVEVLERFTPQQIPAIEKQTPSDDIDTPKGSESTLSDDTPPADIQTVDADEVDDSEPANNEEAK